MSRKWAIFAVGTWGFVLSMFYRVSATVISQDLSADLGLSTIQLADLSALFFYTFAISQLPLGPVLDRLGPRRIMTALNLVAIAGAVTFALAPTAGGVYVGRGLLGVGMSCGLMGTMALVAAWFPGRAFASLSGLVVSIGSLGSLMAATPLALMAKALGWRGAFLCIAAVHLVQAVVFWVVAHDRPADAPPRAPRRKNPLGDLAELYRQGPFWIISLAAFFRFGTHMALQGLWAGPFLLHGLGLSTIQTGNCLVAMSVGYMVGLPAAGRLSDRVVGSRKRVIVPGLLLHGSLVLGLGLLWRGVPVPALWLVFFALGFLSGPGNIMFAHIKELVSPALISTGLTGVNLFTILGSAVLLQAAGYLAPANLGPATTPGEFVPVWGLLGGGILVAATAYLFLVPEGRRDRD